MRRINEKLLWIDYLKVLATIAVIVVHVSAPILGQYGTISKYDWWIGHIFDSSARFCVPIFLMISGALILSKIDSLKDFFKKRVVRIIYPFVFWSLIYILLQIIINWDSGYHMDTYELGKLIFLGMKNGASFHLWYIYMIIGIYLIFPVINKWIIHSSTSDIFYYILIWIIVMVFNAPRLYKIRPNIDLTYFSGFLGYCILGYFLTNIKTNKKTKIISYLLIFIGFFITLYGTYILTEYKGFLVEYFYSYSSPNVIAFSAGIFLLFRDLELTNEKLKKVLLFVSKYSYGIYLSHILVLFFLSNFGLSWNFISPIIGIPLTTMLCLSISSILIYMINKFPFGKFISG